MELFKGNREEFLAYSRLTTLNRSYAKHRQGVEIKGPSMGFEEYLNFIEEEKVYDESLSRIMPKSEKDQTNLNIRYKGNREEEMAVLSIIKKSYNLGLVNEYGVLDGEQQKVEEAYNVVNRSEDTIAKTIEDYKKRMIDNLVIGDEEENEKEREKLGSDEQKQVEFNEKMGLETFEEKDVPNKNLYFNIEKTEDKEDRENFIKRQDHLEEQKL
jgi:hypothetical protein